MFNFNFDVCLAYFYNILAEIFQLKVSLLEEGRNSLKLSSSHDFIALNRKNATVSLVLYNILACYTVFL